MTIQHFSFRDEDPASKLNIIILDDEACPGCGAFWGHPDEALDFPNRPKVHDHEGDWFRCYNPNCNIGYYTEDGKTEMRATPEEEAAMRERIQAQVEQMTQGRAWKETSPGVFKLVQD